MKVTTRYQGQMRFSNGEGPARVVMDAPSKAGGLGEALPPKAMVLQGLVGCTGLDVAAILEKQKVRFEDLTVEASASLTKTTPKIFDKIEIVFRIKADPADREAVIKAIKASQDRFCGVSAMLRKSSELTWELKLQPL